MKHKTLLVGLLVIAVVIAAVLDGSYVTFVPAANAATEDKIEEAIARGVDWLASQQESNGRWGNWQQTAVTCFALVMLKERAYDLGYESPFDPDYPYSDNVTRGWQYIFSVPHAHKQAMGVQSHNGSPDNPDTNGNGYGIYFDTWGRSQTYSTGICLMALVASGTPNRPNDGGLDYNGDGNPDTFREIAQEAVDWLAFAQADSGWPEGGWDYGAQDNAGDRADNSNSGYAVLGLAYGENFGCTVPDWVRTELEVWINHIQYVGEGGNHGGSCYGEPPCKWGNELRTGNLIFEMTFVGYDSSVQRFQDALNYIMRHWRDSNTNPGWGYSVYPADYQAMYTLVKGFKYSGIDKIDTDDDGNRDDYWFTQEPPASPPQDFATVLVAQQNADGSWPKTRWEEEGEPPILSTVWALLTLGRVTPPPPVPLRDALAKTQSALDELTKTPPDKQAAVGNIEGAVGDLEAAVADGLLDPAEGTHLMDQFAAIARQLAVDALDQAIAQGGDPTTVNEAQQALAEGDTLRASGAFKDAVNKYKDALAKAESALP